MAKKILVAIDDSENAMRAVDFVADTFTPDTQITLFNVVQDTAAMCEMNSPELTPYFITEQSSFCLLEEKKKELVENAMQKSKALLMNAGFDEQHITIKAEVKKSGVARDIIKESQSGYNIIVMGKRGVSGIKEFLLGSVSQKVFHLAKDISVMFVN
ncbi:MAG: universal stress protein [Desulfobacterales bacterium]|jgi:nucleotide-binding universal stress UspA family protein|nr:universal stress protein [Desulfobacterales bacterium]